MKPSVLIVEDDAVVAMSLRVMVEDFGFSVTGVAFSADDSMVQAEHDRPDIVLMDIRLKGPRDGVWAGERIQKELDIPVVFLTGNTDEATMMRAMHINPGGYLRKPLSEKLLKSTIEEVLKNWKKG